MKTQLILPLVPPTQFFHSLRQTDREEGGERERERGGDDINSHAYVNKWGKYQTIQLGLWWN